MARSKVVQVSFGNNDKLTDGKSFINRDDLSFLGFKVISIDS